MDPGCFSSKRGTGLEAIAIGVLPSLLELMKVATARGPNGAGFA